MEVLQWGAIAALAVLYWTERGKREDQVEKYRNLSVFTNTRIVELRNKVEVLRFNVANLDKSINKKCKAASSASAPLPVVVKPSVGKPGIVKVGIKKDESK